jgi:hypothetical protein
MQDSPPKNHIGSIFYNSAETQAVSQVIAAVTNVCNKIGTKQSDSAYVNSSVWEELIYTAKRAHNILLANEHFSLFDMEYNAHGYETSDFDLKENSKATLWTWWDRHCLNKQEKISVIHERNNHDLYKRAEAH